MNIWFEHCTLDIPMMRGNRYDEHPSGAKPNDVNGV